MPLRGTSTTDSGIIVIVEVVTHYVSIGLEAYVHSVCFYSLVLKNLVKAGNLASTMKQTFTMY